MFRSLCSLLLAVLAIAVAAPATAQETRGVSEFGAGMHDFNQGRLFEAIRHFDAAVTADARDPRVYFFRGLAKRRLGWTVDAEIDLRLGAQMEVALKRRDVGMALQRIQGPERLVIERFRREARALPEAVVRSVVPQAPSQVPPEVSPPATATAVQPARGSQAPAPATRARYVPSQLADDATDPFVGSTADSLGRGQLQPSAAAPSVSAPSTPAAATAGADDPFGDDFPAADSPVGSGVAVSGSAEGPDPFAAQPRRPAAAGAEPADGGGALGAALRAFARSVAPVGDLVEQGGGLLEDARTAIPGAAPPSGAAPPGPDAFDGPGDEATRDPADGFEEDMGFGDPADAGEETEGEDPFADDPFTDDASATDEPPGPEDSSGDDGAADAADTEGSDETDSLFDF